MLGERISFNLKFLIGKLISLAILGLYFQATVQKLISPAKLGVTQLTGSSHSNTCRPDKTTKFTQVHWGHVTWISLGIARNLQLVALKWMKAKKTRSCATNWVGKNVVRFWFFFSLEYKATTWSIKLYTSVKTMTHFK